MSSFTVGGVCSGIGGLERGLEAAGMTIRWHSEVDPYASAVLSQHWPDVPNLGDLKAVDWSTVEPVDLLCGGYPCQPFSLAGARRGEADPRHLWPFVRDAISVLRPQIALLENVPGHVSLGFDRVLGDLAELGFDAEWDLVPAAAVGAPHLRYRLFIVAYPASDGDTHVPESGDGTVESVGTVARAGDRTRSGHLAERAGVARRGTEVVESVLADADEERRDRRPRFFGPGWWRQPSDRGWWTTEPDVGRVAHGVPRRVDRLRCLGNAVVPQVAQAIGERIMNVLTPSCPECDRPLVDATSDWQCHHCERLWPASFFVKKHLRASACRNIVDKETP